MMGPDITTTGWWTLGLSVSSNGAVHYYARPGVEDLTSDDYISSQYPYSYRAERFRAAFFNVINSDSGRDWTTSWIIDDTYVFTGTGSAQLVQRNRHPGNAPEARLARSSKSVQSTEPNKSNRYKQTKISSAQATDREGSLSDDQPTPESDGELDYYRDE